MFRRNLFSSDQVVGIVFIAPFLITAAIFMVYPIAEAIRLAFISYNPLRPDASFYVGLANFQYVFSGFSVLAVDVASGRLDALSTLFQTIFGVGIALLLHRTIFGIAFFRGLLLFPYIVPTVVIALIWRWIFNPEIGVVNYGLQAAGIIDAPIYWLSTPTWRWLRPSC